MAAQILNMPRQKDPDELQQKVRQVAEREMVSKVSWILNLDGAEVRRRISCN